MTDNCPEERDALSTVWPEAKLILCTFHILQQVWRWLHESKNGVDKFDRPTFDLSNFKSLVYAGTIEIFEEEFQKLLDDELITVRYNSYGEYLKSLHRYKECTLKKLLLAREKSLYAALNHMFLGNVSHNCRIFYYSSSLEQHHHAWSSCAIARLSCMRKPFCILRTAPFLSRTQFFVSI